MTQSQTVSSLSPDLAGQMLNKVPQITLYFWVIKVLCTTVGETASDFLNVNLNLGLNGTSVVMGIVLLIVLFIQIKTKRYIPAIYWLTVVLISVFGTLVTDILTDSIGVPLEYSTILFSILLAATFALWYAKEKTLSIHSIFTRQREIFYWIAILFTFSLGTASGDLMAESLGLGYFTTGVIVAVVMTIFAIAWKLGLNHILAFWLIYIMTRPLGASLGDYLTQSGEHGGLGLGATVTSVIFLLAILVTVLFLAFTKRDVITNPEVDEEADDKGWHVGLQVAAVAVLLVAVSVGGYYWRQNALKAQAQADIAAPAVTPSGNAPAAAPQSPLGDLSAFKKITQDTLDLVNKNDMPGAKNRVADLEYEWDNAEARLKPKAPAKWTEVDGAIDKVLRAVRAVNPDAQNCKSVLEALLSSLDKP